jgi:aminoglycoside phosphotransferase (APT) family kinase protein
MRKDDDEISISSDLKNKDIETFLIRNGLLKPGETAVYTSLAGGVSSDIWRVELPKEIICVKRALSKLKVVADWRAPVERNNSEWEWFNFAYKHFPSLVPRPIAHDREMQMLAMEFLPPDKFAVWKTQLLDGIVDTDFAAAVGKYLGKIHAASAFNSKIAETFATDDLFFALRIEPYLLATAEKHSELSNQIKSVAEKTLSAKIALVHGDVSLKNILVGKDGPIFLDAETAWYGDPAFDAAFCLNHFLLKALHRRDLSADYLNCFKRFANGYLDEVTWEGRDEIELRIARLLPILFLARVDGKSPVEYITDENTKNTIRRYAKNWIDSSEMNLSDYPKAIGRI